MKKFVILSLLFLTACTGSTPHGECIGVLDDKNPKLEYKISKWNVFVGIILSETLIVPGVILFSQTFCPTGVKK